MSKIKPAGNALFIILLAIAMLGMLTAVVTQMTGSNMKAPDTERLGLKVSDVIQYAESLKTGVERVYLHNRRSESDIRFAHPDLDAAYGNPNTLDPEQMVFHTLGGGVDYRNPPAGVNDGTPWFFTGSSCIPMIGTGTATNCTSAGTSASDLLVILPNITEAFCTALRKTLGMSGSIPADTGTAYDISDEHFDGSFAASHAIANLDGQSQGCFEGDTTPASGTYHFYKVLLAR